MVESEKGRDLLIHRGLQNDPYSIFSKEDATQEKEEETDLYSMVKSHSVSNSASNRDSQGGPVSNPISREVLSGTGQVHANDDEGNTNCNEPSTSQNKNDNRPADSPSSNDRRGGNDGGALAKNLQGGSNDSPIKRESAREALSGEGQVHASDEERDADHNEPSSNNNKHNNGPTDNPSATDEENENKYRDMRELQREVAVWLRRYLPKLTKEDAMRYRNALIDRGFDEGESLNLLDEEDLDFMKKGHRQLLLKKLCASCVD